jgi:chaperone modulatory protein CbpM
VEEGVIEPAGRDETGWLFYGAALVRAQAALRLVRDLEVNWPGAALALDLLEELDRL